MGLLARSKRVDAGSRTNPRSQNLLTMIPSIREGLQLDISGEGAALVIPRTSWLERLSVKYMKQPAAIRIKLDALGEAVLSQCDGQRTVEDIAVHLRQTFGEAAEPLYPRLVKFLEIVEANGWITWKKQ
ncbi:PqqD family peptide modification chaperone [Brevibacillus dissolubilis]|uniref:PqqD family peptide modification chaperone n=1 Tax=Brevibacillus dissolubilis TaxID=1844116 RepID=UPI0021003BD7|nr:PqqD family peptide modification chaperone [Brevibacillus dissolubilis]